MARGRAAGSGAVGLPRWQQAIRDRAFHPRGRFTPVPRRALRMSIAERFAEVAATWPNRIALGGPETRLDYRSLSAAAARVASAVASSGGPRTPVGILFDHGIAQLVAVLGSLLAGRGYVPLDPSYPAARLRFIVADSGIRSVLASEPHAALAAELGPLDVLTAPRGIGDAPVAVPSTASVPSASAVILYTSGSTGAPKGFSQTHRNIIHDVRNYANAAHYSPDDRFLLVSSLSFADSLRTIFGALLTGGSLFPFDLQRCGFEGLARWLASERLTIYRSVPTVFRQLVRSLSASAHYPDLRLVFLSGEPVYQSDVAAYRKHFADECVLVNRLGTGEALTYCMCFIDKATRIIGVHAPVGFPVEGKRVFLRDPSDHNGRPTGEIVVQSRYLTPGYLNRPELTAATFLPDPAGGGERAYLTGDLGEQLPDGSFVHLGRKDFQVKIRGHRVETAEVELRLLAHPAIAECVVVARPGPDGTAERLVAYLALEGAAPPSVTRLRRELADSLPDYMIPSAFVTLPEFPRTLTGKLDRRSLPASSDARPDLDVPYAPPRDELEALLCGIWGDVLGLQTIGIRDPFLDLGGDSLRAVQVVSRVTDEFGSTVQARALFEAETVEKMAAALTG